VDRKSQFSPSFLTVSRRVDFPAFAKLSFVPLYRLANRFFFCCICLWLHGLGSTALAQKGKYQFPLSDLASHDEIHLKPAPGNGLILKADSIPSLFFLPGVQDGYAWNSARYLVLEIEHQQAHSINLHLDFFAGQKDDRSRVRFKTGILPGLLTRVLIPLSYLSAQSIYIPKYPRQLKGTLEGTFMTPSEVAKVRISISPFQFPHFQPSINIRNIYLSDELPPMLPPPVATLVDSLGQWKGRDWPGKTKSLAQLKRRIRKQIQNAELKPVLPDPYLGNPNLRFLASGFFRTHFDGQRWWLVDPEGYAFLSSGIDCIRSHIQGPVQATDDLLSWLPSNDTTYKKLFSRSRNQVLFNFLGANLQRALGPEWRDDWFGFARSFLLENGYNTVGNWSEMAFCRNAKIPWVYPMTGFPVTAKTIFRDFPDVFDPGFKDSCQKFASQLETYKDDRYMIGYFLRNEPEWAFGEHNLAAEMLANPWKSHSRTVLVNWLKNLYNNDIQKLNLRWEEQFSSFDALDSGSIVLTGLRARQDLMPFTERLVDSLIGKVCRAVKRVDPHHLNLGMRYAWISSDLCYRAGAYFDVFSVNGYGPLAPSQTKIIEQRTHKPVLIGEFHIGTLDRGLPASGISAALNTKERAWAIRRYMEDAFSRPEVIGIHYFQLFDQPFTGRFDGENYQIGLLDVCNQPYKEVMDEIKKAHRQMYKIARKRRPPFDPPLTKVLPIFY
jgi:hypothetical protein